MTLAPLANASLMIQIHTASALGAVVLTNRHLQPEKGQPLPPRHGMGMGDRDGHSRDQQFLDQHNQTGRPIQPDPPALDLCPLELIFCGNCRAQPPRSQSQTRNAGHGLRRTPDCGCVHLSAKQIDERSSFRRLSRSARPTHWRGNRP